ncbi:hypothetical protein M9H77_33923 [Catharanthus roseus]|uniref:Uncharacterized protein n=1 Tax=Catharanthus roseus TaxID=4058 RepID=A0ACB9ZLI7_CATRO|nr:hypothetical protein M9H77_33923 [Catharanthus roseus]
MLNRLVLNTCSVPAAATPCLTRIEYIRIEDGSLWRKLLLENLVDAIENGTRDQHSDALVSELNNQFEKCQQLINSISGSINSKSMEYFETSNMLLCRIRGDPGRDIREGGHKQRSLRRTIDVRGQAGELWHISHIDGDGRQEGHGPKVPLTVEGQKRKLEGNEYLLNQRRDHISKYKNSMEELLKSEH